MRFSIYPCYNLDLLNLMNVITGEEFYVSYHKDAFTQFGEPLSQDSQRHIKEAVDVNGSAMLGPFLCLVISAVPSFESRSVARMFSDVKPLTAKLLTASLLQSREVANPRIHLWAAATGCKRVGSQTIP